MPMPTVRPRPDPQYHDRDSEHIAAILYLLIDITDGPAIGSWWSLSFGWLPLPYFFRPLHGFRGRRATTKKEKAG